MWPAHGALAHKEFLMLRIYPVLLELVRFVRPFVNELERQLSEESPAIRNYAADLAYGAASDWLMRCPLDLR